MLRSVHGLALALIFASTLHCDFASASEPSVEEGEDSVCSRCNGKCVVSEQWYYEPGSITNANRGDVLLYKGPGITAMLSIGFVWTHAGLMLDSSHVRHTTMDLETPMKVVREGPLLENLIRGILGDLYGVVHFDYQQLYHGAPGSITSYADREKAFGYRELSHEDNAWRGMQALLKPTSLGGRQDAVSATDWLEGMRYEYRLHAFYNTAATDRSGGNGCSGAIAAATRHASMSHTGAIIDPETPTEIVSLAVLNLRQELYDNKIRPMISADERLRLVSTEGHNEIAWTLADQIVNCFLYLQGPDTGCARIDQRYILQAREALGLGNYSLPLLAPAVATAPDHLALSGGRNGLSEQGSDSLAKQADLPHWANELPWMVADTPSVRVYLPRINNWEGGNAGPWNGGALVSPQYTGGRWNRSNAYHCE